jgi:hypothetical protein
MCLRRLLRKDFPLFFFPARVGCSGCVVFCGGIVCSFFMIDTGDTDGFDVGKPVGGGLGIDVF